MQENYRWSLTEYDAPKDLLSAISNHAGRPRQQVRELILRSAEKASLSLGLSYNPIIIIDDSIRVIDIAGLLRVAPDIELEIAPKFLGLDIENARWREDFFFLATLSRHGHLLASDKLQANSEAYSDLHTLVARSMIDMYWSNHRRPLRKYRLKTFKDFSLDGDVEPEELIQPGSEGFPQAAMFYDRNNMYNATILAAAHKLLPNLHDPGLLIQLERMIHALSPQRKVYRINQNTRLPNRFARWQPLYDLSVDILKGFGLSYANGRYSAPGYILNTWRVWEDLLSISLRMGFGESYSRTQFSSPLGTRKRNINKHTTINVRPDIAIFNANGSLRFLIDAKYKGHIRKGQNRISEADLYEALAFAKASKCNKIALGYPALAGSLELGQVVVFENITVDNVQIYGVEIETRGISAVAGLTTFAKRCTKMITEILES